MNDLWFQILLAAVMGFFLIRMLPATMYWVKNSPKGSSKQWLTAAMLLGGVALFVVFLISVVRS